MKHNNMDDFRLNTDEESRWISLKIERSKLNSERPNSIIFMIQMSDINLQIYIF